MEKADRCCARAPLLLKRALGGLNAFLLVCFVSRWKLLLCFSNLGLSVVGIELDIVIRIRINPSANQSCGRQGNKQQSVVGAFHIFYNDV